MIPWLKQNWLVLTVAFSCGGIWTNVKELSIGQEKQWQVMSQMNDKVTQAANDIGWLKRLVNESNTTKTAQFK